MPRCEVQASTEPGLDGINGAHHPEGIEQCAEREHNRERRQIFAL